MKLNHCLAAIALICILVLTVTTPVFANPALRVDQTVPDTFINDTAGQTYQATITNIGDMTAQNVAVNIDIPAGFYKIGTPTALFKTDSDDPGTPVAITITGSDPFDVSFDIPLSLAPGQIVEITYQLATTLLVAPGNSSVNTITVNESYTYIDIHGEDIPANESYQRLVYVKQGIINVTLTPINPLPFQASRGETITLEARLTNSGDGPLYNVNFTATWGANFSSPQLVGGNVTPTQSGNSYIYTTGIADAVQPGASVYFRYQLTVSDYHFTFALHSTATSDPVSPGNPGSAAAVFTFIIQQPNINITSTPITIDYGAPPQAAQIVISNSGPGPARQFKLNTNIHNIFTVSDISSSWTYANGVFTYNGGPITQGNPVTLTYKVTPAHPENLLADPTSGSILITPSYQNDIDQGFSYPIVYQNYSISNIPVLGLTQTIRSEATDSDNSRVYLGEHIHIDYTPTLTRTAKWSSPEIVLTDTVPSYFTVENVTVTGVPAGTIVWTPGSNTIEWRLTPVQAATSPKLTIDLQVTTDPGLANTILTNSATISGTTLWCPLSVTRTASFYLQSRDDAESNFSYESKIVTNLPGEGSFDVCGKDGKNIIEYQIEYSFGATSNGTWTGSSISDQLNQSQTYVAGTAQYSTGDGNWHHVPGGSITGTTLQLTIDLEFLKNDLFGGDDLVRGKAIYFKYQLRLTNASLPLGGPTSRTFTSVTELMLNGATGGSGAIGNTFYQGVFVPISRAALNLSANLGTAEVSKGQIVHTTITVANVGNTPWNKNNLTITLTTPTASGSPNGSYSYLTPLILNGSHVTGFNGAIPAVTIVPGTPEKIKFEFSTPVTAGGTISFDLVKTDSDNYTLQAQLDFDDDLNGHSAAMTSATPFLCMEGILSLIVNPDPIQVNANTISWQINVTNIGSGIAYGTVLEDNLNGILDYVSSIPAQTAQNGTTVSWNLGDINPGQSQSITITAHTNDNADFDTHTNQITAKLTWVDRIPGNHYFNPATAVAKPEFNNVNSTSSTFVENRCDDHVELGSYATLKLHVKNNGWTTNYNYIIKQDFKETGFVYQPGTTKIDGIDVNDSLVTRNGATLTFSGLPQFQALTPQGEFTLTFRVYAPESFNSKNKIQASATWQLPTDNSLRSGLINGAEFLVPQFLPNITVAVDGKLAAADDSTYTKNVVAVAGDLIKWRIRITNSGTADAKGVVLQNIIPTNMTFNSISAFTSTPATDPVDHSAPPANTLWGIADIAKGTTATYYVTAAFTGNCGSVQQNRARVTWGPDSSSLSTPGHNTDFANFITQAAVNSVTATISNFTTKAGRVNITFTTSGAPLHDLVLPLDISNRFQVDSEMTYGGSLPVPVTAPVSGDSGVLTWRWDGGLPIQIPAGTYMIGFNIRDKDLNCNNGSPVTSLNNYTFKNSTNDLVNGSYSLDATPAKAILAVTKTPAVQVAQNGSTVTWVIQVTNTGDADATDLEIVDTLGDGTAENGFTYSATTSPPPNVIHGNVLKWTGLDLNVGQTYTITLIAMVNAAGIHTSSVTATEYNRDFLAKVAEKSADAAVAMVGMTKALDQSTGVGYDASADSYGEIVKYTISINFQDTSDYSNVIIRDTLPAGLQYVSETRSATLASITPNHAGKNLTWDLSSFTGPDMVSITYYARIIDESQARGSNLINAAKCSFDTHYGNGMTASFPNTLSQLQSQQAFILQRPDVILSGRSALPASGSVVTADQVINHTLTVLNQDLPDVSPAYQVIVREILPSGARTAAPTASVIVKKNSITALALNTDYTCTYISETGQLTVAMLDTPLGILQKNETYEITYSTMVDSNIGAGQTLNHSAQLASYYSQPAATAGSKSYTGNTRNAGFTTQNSIYALTINSPASGKVKPGDTVSYRITLNIPKGTSIYDFHLADTLPAGLSYNLGSSDGLNKSGSIFHFLSDPMITGNIATGQTLTWVSESDNVDITNNDAADWVLTLDFTATVLDVEAIAQGNILTNSAIFNFNKVNNSSGSRTNNISQTVNVTVNEPALAISKTVTSAGPYQAGNTISYKITLQNTSTEIAFDVAVTDTLDSKLTLSGTPTSNPGGIAFSQNGQQLTWGSDGNLDIAPGGTVDILVNAALNDTVNPREPIGSAATAEWTSKDAFNANERIYNASTSAANVTIVDNTDLSKTISGSPTYVIGETFHYQLLMTLTKGTTANVIVYDTLPAGVEFVSATITPDGSGAVQYTLSHNPQPGEQNTINWNFGSITVPKNQGNTLIIDYVVRIMNTPGNQAGQTCPNNAYLSYQDGLSVGHNTPNRTQTFTVKEPDLAISQSYASGIWEAGNIVSCTVRVWHNSIISSDNVSAYDLIITVDIPSGMSYIPGSSSPAATLDSGKLSWQINQLNTTYTAGSPLTLTYNVQLADTVQPGQSITGNTNLTWTSLPGPDPNERTGTDGVGGLNDYRVTTSATLNATDTLNLTGTRLGSPNRPVGDEVSYQLEVHLNEGTSVGVQVKNTIPPGMEFVSATIAKGHDEISYSLLGSPSPGATGQVVWNFGAIVNPSNGDSTDDTVTIYMVAVVKDLLVNNNGHILINQAHMEYIDGQGNPQATAIQHMDVTIIEPQLAVNASGPSTISPGQQPAFTVNIPNIGTGTAWQTSFNILFPPEMRHQAPLVQSLKAGTRTLSETGPDDYDVTYDPTSGLWGFVVKSNNARIDAGETMTLIFQSALNSDQVFTGYSINILASLTQYYSRDTGSGMAPATRTYLPGLKAPMNLDIQTPVIETSSIVDKPIARPGDTVRFTVTLTNNGNADASGVIYQGEMDAAFTPGTLRNATCSYGAANITVNPDGGSNGTGRISISNIIINQGDTVTIQWDITLKPVWANGYPVQDTATLDVPHFPDSIAINLNTVTIDSAPVFTVHNTDTDINGGTLAPGEIIKYTITVRNTGNEDAINSFLKDLIPSNTSYVPNTTKLNGVNIADDGSGQCPLVNGMMVQTPGDAGGWLTVGKTATVEYEVQVDPGVAGFTIISNQAELTASGEGSGPIPILFSDDPDTAPVGDATLSVVGASPFLYAYKTVMDNNGDQLLPGETLTYHISLTNFGVNNATETIYTDYIPADTGFVNGSITVNGIPAAIVPEGNQFTLNLGSIAPGNQTVITYQVTVNGGTNGHIITCQGAADCAELPPVFSDADGNPANGYQATEIPVGGVPVLRAIMSVADSNGNQVEADDQLEYTIRIANIGGGDATNVTLITPIPNWTTYINNSTKIEGVSIADRSDNLPLLTPGVNLGTIMAGETKVVQYRVRVNHNTPPGAVIDCQANFTADGELSGISDSNLDDGLETGNNPSNPNDDDPTRVQLSGNPSVANVTGMVWWDQNYNNLYDSGEPKEKLWSVEIYQGSTLIQSTTTNISGTYQFIGLIPGAGYQLRFKDQVNGQVWHIINNVTLLAGTILDNQDYPLQPTGVVYDAVTRQPVAGATVTINGPSGFNPTTHLGTGQASQVTGDKGFYYYNILFNQGAPDGNYTLSVTPAPVYSPVFPSTILPPQSGAFTPANLEAVNSVVANATPPQGSDPTTYYLSWQLVSTDHVIVNNHIALDPILQGSVVLAKTAAKKSAAIGDFVPYTVQLENKIAALIQPLTLQDRLPSGFKYVKGSARVNGVKLEPTGETTLSWTNLSLPPHGKMVITYVLLIGSQVMEGNIYKNSATALHGITNTTISNTGTAQVQVIGEPLFTASLVAGKVFNDLNANGVQDPDEKGIAGIRIITASGQIIITDSFGRYHLDGFYVSHSSRGQNIVLKVDPNSVPAGMVFTTENPRVIRITQGLMGKVNFGLRIPPEAIKPTIETPAPILEPVETPTPVAYPDITLTKVNPEEGLVNTKATVTITGSGFRPGIQAAFTKERSELVVTDTQFISDTQISVDLDLKEAVLQKYDLTVTNDDGKSAALTEAYLVKEPEPAPRNRVSPQKGFNNGSLLITLTGPDITPGVDIKLINSFGVTIPGIIVSIQKLQIEAFFDLKDRPTGRYDCYAFYPDGHSVMLNNPVEVREFSAELYHAQTLFPVYFDFDKANIRTNQSRNVERDLKVLLENPNSSIMLGGYTDERGSYIYNLGLSMRRAEAVKQYFIKRGVKPERITIYSYGKEFAQQGSDEKVWQNDRRVDVVIFEDQE